MATVADYPTRATVYWLKQVAVAPDFEPVTNTHQYEDGGMSFNSSDDTGVLMWEIEYDGLTAAQAALLDAHFASAALANDFSFVDRDGVTFTACHYKSFEKGWNKIYAQSRKVVLCRYPNS